MDFNKKELDELKLMLEQWYGEGFVSDLTDVQKSLLSKMDIEFD